jgi:hypothetical protein
MQSGHADGQRREQQTGKGGDVHWKKFTEV